MSRFHYCLHSYVYHNHSWLKYHLDIQNYCPKLSTCPSAYKVYNDRTHSHNNDFSLQEIRLSPIIHHLNNVTMETHNCNWLTLILKFYFWLELQRSASRISKLFYMLYFVLAGNRSTRPRPSFLQFHSSVQTTSFMQSLVPDQSSEGLNALKQLTSCNTAHRTHV